MGVIERFGDSFLERRKEWLTPHPSLLPLTYMRGSWIVDVLGSQRDPTLTYEGVRGSGGGGPGVLDCGPPKMPEPCTEGVCATN